MKAASKKFVSDKLLEMDIRELREMSGKTQVEVAQAMEIAQSELSRLERRDDHLVSTLRKYVKALDGDLEIVARFGNKSIKLHSL
ncbi:MAG: helix-turn-helix transcriptional regulator [Deltaproteobacteria bacterium]|nr:helix-turn-helix transcriptional regulator [Deltaproteobacteria bacterium]